jgi:UDP-2,3-diacylglucosamine hydrolase
MSKSLKEGRIGLVAGRGTYPRMVLEGARRDGRELVVAAFEGETEPTVASRGRPSTWLRVGQLGGLVSFFKNQGVDRAIFAGQITPKRLYDLRPDLKALWILAQLKERNAATLFGAVVKELEKAGCRPPPSWRIIWPSPG